MKKLLFAICLCLTGANVALASGISVSPAKLEWLLSQNKKIADKTITIANPTADVLLIEVYADEFSNIITAHPQTFTLEAGALKSVQVQINKLNWDNSQSAILSTNLSVTARPLAESQVNIGAGVKIPITIQLDSKKKYSIPPLYGLFLLTGILALFLLSQKNTKKTLAP